ncbi:MAG: hypothetical protein HYY23_20830 [Verrucomicrobia bacterium]|nr:hypothetical protein [Verrucomicrobiota bacterium]
MSTPAAVASPWGAVDFMVDFNTRDKKSGLLTETLLEGCSTSEKDRYREALHRLLDEARAGSNVSRQA